MNSSVVSGGTQGLDRLDNILFPEETTLVRTIACIRIQPVVVESSLNNLQLISVGIGVCSQDAFTAGAVADPNVDTDFPQDGWVYKCRWNLLGNAGNTIEPIKVDFDIRAMRKLGRGSSYVVFDNSPGAGTPFTVRFFMLIRQLYLLP